MILLGAFVRKVCNGDIRAHNTARLLRMTGPEQQQAERVLQWYKDLYSGSIESQILQLMGLFDRPADPRTLRALRESQPIDGITDRLIGLSDIAWRTAVAELRDAALIAEPYAHEPDILDAHALVREYYDRALLRQNPTGYRMAHQHVFDHLVAASPKRPTTIQEMAPLYSAVRHGCKAGRFNDAYGIYWHNICRQKEYYSRKVLGANDADLEALTSFFTSPWTSITTAISDTVQAEIYNITGLRLLGLGRLIEARQAWEQSLNMHVRQKRWDEAAIDTTNLEELYTTMGMLAEATAIATQGIRYAGRQTNPFYRIITRTALADALHMAGDFVASLRRFQEAEKLQQQWKPDRPFLHSLRGYQYCQLLLSINRYGEVRTRAREALKWEEGYILSVALDHLALAESRLLQHLYHNNADLAKTERHLARAVEGVQLAGRQDYLPRALRARAYWASLEGDVGRSRDDLREAMNIAEQGHMRLEIADNHLALANAYFAARQRRKAMQHLSAAEHIINDTGYRRRKKIVLSLKQLLMT